MDSWWYILYSKFIFSLWIASLDWFLGHIIYLTLILFCVLYCEFTSLKYIPICCGIFCIRSNIPRVIYWLTCISPYRPISSYQVNNCDGGVDKRKEYYLFRSGESWYLILPKKPALQSLSRIMTLRSSEFLRHNWKGI